MHKLFIDGKEQKNTGTLSWSDNIDGLSTQLQFPTTARIAIGSRFFLMNDSKEILRGIIIDESYDKNKIYQYTGFDYGFYLNKNEVVIQYNGVSGQKAIIQLLNMVNIPVGNIANLPITIKKIYKGTSVSDIIKEILENAHKKTGLKYSIKVQYGKVNIVQSKEILVNAFYNNSGSLINIVDSVSNFSATNSIQDMKNSIIIADQKDKAVKTLASAKDNKNINTYGLLQKVESPDQDIKASNQSIANNLLKELNKISKTKSCEMLGSDEIISGVVLKFNYPELSFTGKYFVNQVDHTVINNIHKMKLDLEAVE